MIGKPLSANEQQELVEKLVELAQSGMPLGSGLEAAARETSSRRLARLLSRLSKRLDAGATWQDIFIGNEAGLPPHVLGLMQAGIRSGALVQTLDDLVDYQQWLQDLWRRVWWALCYPLTLLLVLSLLIVFVLLMVVAPMKRLYEDFGTELPASTQGWLWFADSGLKILAGLALFVAASCAALRLFGGRVPWTRFLSSMPVFGALLHWSGVAEFARLLRNMLARQVPLPEALQLTASGISNANIADVARWLAKGTADGIPISDLMAATPRLPASLVPIVRWGEQTGALAEAMASASEMFEGRIDLRSATLTTVLPPLCFLAVAAGAIGLVLGLFSPLVMLIQNLT